MLSEMQLKRINILLFLLLCLLGSCHANKAILYKSSSTSVQKSIKDILAKISQDAALDIRQKNIFVLMYEDRGLIVMVFNNSQKFPPEYKKVIKNSNRFFLVNGNQKIPVIFPWDCLTIGCENYSWHLGGQVLEINYQQEVIREGHAW